MAYTTIDDPSGTAFNTVLYTGDGTSSRSITGVGFQPDWIWIKGRNQARNNTLFDIVRGVQIQLHTNKTSAESTQTNALSSYDSDGFSVGNNTGVNENTTTYASWNWLAGGSASSNSNGSITSSVSANTTAGFSIVSYTGNSTGGATVGHGLGSVPNWIIVKDRDNTRSWTVYHQGMGNTHGIYLNATSTKDDDSVYWNDTTPSSSVFTLGSSNETNASASMIAYCFAEKKGYSKFGSYTGNNNTDGTFVYTGFKPAWVMMKATTASEHWNMHDNKRDPINVCDAGLKSNENNAEEDADRLDFVSNGFKHRSSSGGYNSSNTFIYMAFAESPFVNSNGIPTNAR